MKQLLLTSAVTLAALNMKIKRGTKQPKNNKRRRRQKEMNK